MAISSPVVLLTTEENAAVPSLPLTLVARLLPVAVLAAAGWSMTTQSPSDSRRPSSAPKPSLDATTARLHAKPPATACTTLSSATVKKLVPGAKTAGKPLKSSDPARRTGCSWNALDGFDYRWLDVTFEIAGENAGGLAGAREFYADRKRATGVPDLGDEASVGTELTKDDGQQTMAAVVVVRTANAVVTVTHSGSDFETRKAPSADAMREGAVAAAEQAVAALGS
ncbi:hypothetical protein [Streptomyces sp. KR80]|uniref:hypothetical protein n=1 Tax=Streptomyces sp. KR80 TaxID=3457426 RepID=UPI003FD07343